MLQELKTVATSSGFTLHIAESDKKIEDQLNRITKVADLPIALSSWDIDISLTFDEIGRLENPTTSITMILLSKASTLLKQDLEDKSEEMGALFITFIRNLKEYMVENTNVGVNPITNITFTYVPSFAASKHSGVLAKFSMQLPISNSSCEDTPNEIGGGGGTVPDYGELPSIVAHSTNFILLDNPFVYNINARNSPTSYGATGLVDGLTIDTTTGVISGQLDTSSVVVEGLSFNVTISATNAVGTDTRTVVFEATNQTTGTLLAPYDLTIGSTEGVSVSVSFRLRDYDGTISGAEVYRQGLLHDTVYFTGNESEFSKRFSTTAIDNDGEYLYKVRIFNSAGEFSDFTDEVLHDSVFSGTLNISTNESVVKTNPTLDDAIIYCKFDNTDADPLINVVDNTFGQWRLSGSRNYDSSGLVDSSLVLAQDVGQTVTFPMTHQFITGNTHADPTNYNNSEDLPFSVSIWFKVDIPTTPEIVNIPLFGANNGNALGGSFGANLTIYYDNGIQKLDTSRMRFTLTDYRTIDDGVGKEKIDWFDLKKPVTSGWNHVCINYNGLPNGEDVKPIRIYLNNEYYGGVFNYFAGETIKYRGMTNNPTNLIIGSESTSQYKPRIEYDEFALFSRMLTKDEVNFLYNDGLGQSIS